MIKLKPLVELNLQKVDDTPTWGEVNQIMVSLIGKKNKSDAIKAISSLGKLGISLLPGISLLSSAVSAYDSIPDFKILAKILFNVGKEASYDLLKNPKSSEFKKLSSPFWNAVRLDPEISIILDDKIEKQFLDQIILPKLQEPGNENEKIPNMNYELGKWLNKKGLINADIFFKGKQGDL